MLFRSNENPPTPERTGWLGNKARAWGWSGVMGADLRDHLLRTSAETGQPEKIWSGIGSYALVGGTNQTLVAFTNQHRSEALYWTMLNNAVVISNSAAALSMMRTGGQPKYSPLGIAGFLMHGLPFTDSVPFANVRVLPAAARITSDERADIMIDHDVVEIRRDEDAAQATAGNIANGLVDYARTLTAGSADVVAAITGGKDSRLVVSALHAAGVDFEAYTNGLPESGEGVVGQQVTQALGVPHRLNVPKVKRTKSGGAVVIGRPEEQAWATLRSTGGMGNAFTVLPDPAKPHISAAERTKFGGQGGEIVRGGFARRLNNEKPTSDRAEEIFRDTWYKNRGILIPLAREAVERDTRDLFEPIVGDPAGALFEGYVRNRTGRWLATMRHGESVVSSHTTLLINNHMVRELRSLPSSAMLAERMAHNIMASLAPQVVDLAFFRDRWAFEADGPDSRYKPDSWGQRAPYTAHDQPRADFNWRTDYPVLGRFFHEYIFSTPTSMLFDVIDRTAVEKMFRASAYKGPLAWALFSVQYMLTNQWLGERPSNVESLEIPVP